MEMGDGPCLDEEDNRRHALLSLVCPLCKVFTQDKDAMEKHLEGTPHLGQVKQRCSGEDRTPEKEEAGISSTTIGPDKDPIPVPTTEGCSSEETASTPTIVVKQEQSAYEEISSPEHWHQQPRGPPLPDNIKKEKIEVFYDDYLEWRRIDSGEVERLKKALGAANRARIDQRIDSERRFKELKDWEFKDRGKIKMLKKQIDRQVKLRRDEQDKRSEQRREFKANLRDLENRLEQEVMLRRAVEDRAKNREEQSEREKRGLESEMSSMKKQHAEKVEDLEEELSDKRNRLRLMEKKEMTTTSRRSCGDCQHGGKRSRPEDNQDGCKRRRRESPETTTSRSKDSSRRKSSSSRLPMLTNPVIDPPDYSEIAARLTDSQLMLDPRLRRYARDSNNNPQPRQFDAKKSRDPRMNRR